MSQHSLTQAIDSRLLGHEQTLAGVCTTFKIAMD